MINRFSKILLSNTFTLTIILSCNRNTYHRIKNSRSKFRVNPETFCAASIQIKSICLTNKNQGYV
ncbi:hypothetical protein H8356DRAFT_1345762 [Neocallimastix lanati (nom. inval.)]|nr:hypothetical protein H8356DRAFT_1345762 [Neocallimastix sp. JGI-2020a]